LAGSGERKHPPAKPAALAGEKAALAGSGERKHPPAKPAALAGEEGGVG